MASFLVALAVVLIYARKGRTAAVDYSHRPYGSCQQLDIPVYASAPGADYGIPQIQNDIEATAFAIHSDTWNGTYNIHGQLCVPEISKSLANKSDILQIATHGAFYDGRYWDATINAGNNSYIEAALRAGYSIFAYDRLSTGQSDKPDAYSVAQAPFELEILHQLTLMARNGTMHDLAKKAAPVHNAAFQHISRPSKIVHVGHSFGSVLTSAYLVAHGSLSDGAIITGFIPNKELATTGSSSFALEYAATSRLHFADRSSGYVAPNTRGIQTIFFGGDVHIAFTKQMLDYADLTKQPIAVAEYVSAHNLQLAGSTASSFHGPLQYMLGEFDHNICHGDCKGTYDLSALRAAFPHVSELEVVLQPNTGHALPLHNNATAGFQISFDFLSRNGL